MKLYDSFGPNPRIVRMFLAEKGMSIPVEEVDLRAAANRQEPYLTKNPAGQLPSLELDDGNVIAELASQPAIERLRDAIGELDARQQTLAAQGLMLGIVIDENQPAYERGDFLVRPILGALRAGVLRTLVTDVATAEAVLALDLATGASGGGEA